MCCTPINREKLYQKELRYVYFAAEFFKSIYPNSKIFIGTTKNAEIPIYLKEKFNFLNFPFEKYPFALARQIFYKEFCKSEYFTETTILAGSDVIFSNEIKFTYHKNPVAMTYRYHPTMPYCSDFVLINKDFKFECIEFFNNIINYIKWMPKEIQSSWADQLAIARTIGYLKDEEFDGKEHLSPNFSKIKLVPGDDYLYTPNDAFPSKKVFFNGSNVNDVSTLLDYENLLKNKIGIHFKGNRKKYFILLCYVAHLKKIKKFNDFSEYMQYQDLFSEGIDIYSRSLSL